MRCRSAPVKPPASSAFGHRLTDESDGRYRCYLIAGRKLGTTQQLPELSPGQPPADLTFTVSRSLPSPDAPKRCFTSGDNAWLEVQETPRHLWFTFPGLAVFTIDVGTHEIVGFAEDGAQRHTLRHLLIDQVVPLYLVSQGVFVLHASGVIVTTPRGRRAVIFLGASGAGKSTAAVGCTLAGAELLADDFVVVNPIKPAPTATPAGVGARLSSRAVRHLFTPPSVRLPVAEYSDKKRVLVNRQTDGRDPVPIGAMVWLGPRGGAFQDVLLEPTSSADSVMHVIGQAFRLDRHSKQANHDSLLQAASLVDLVPVLKSTLPETLDDLVPTCRRLLDLVGQEMATDSSTQLTSQ